MGILSNNDIYTAQTNPTADVNPKTVGAMWINTETCTQFICKDNTKDKNVWSSSWDNIYPVGSVFLTMSNIDPNKHFGGKWRKEAGNRTLWLSSSNAGSYISPGLPNITGAAGVAIYGLGMWGAFWPEGCEGNIKGGGGCDPYARMDASRCSPIYGRSDTVQPPAIRVYCWIREA